MRLIYWKLHFLIKDLTPVYCLKISLLSACGVCGCIIIAVHKICLYMSNCGNLTKYIYSCTVLKYPFEYLYLS